MIAGVGVDICSVERMSRSMKSPHFLERVFLPLEREYAFSRAKPERHLAAAFAAKEAFAKATGEGLGRVGLHGCWVKRVEGRPWLEFSERNRLFLRHKGVEQVFLSISHEAGLALAVVLLEGYGGMRGTLV